MPISLPELMHQRDEIDRQIRVAQLAARKAAIARIRELMHQHGLSPTDLLPAASSAKAAPGKKVKPKYMDPESGATWSGRGLRPKWLATALAEGKSMSDFAI